jgi:hypothetical protein
MTSTLTAAETRVASYLDDASNADASTAQIDDALAVAFPVVYERAITIAPLRFMLEASKDTDANGKLDLTTLSPAPLRLVSVNYAVSGITRTPIPAASLADGPQNATGVKTLLISYIPAVTFPANGGANFVWGQSSLNLPQLDDLMCMRAASALTIYMDQPNATLEAAITRAERDLDRMLNPTTWKIMPLRGRSRDSGFGYVLTDATSLQLVNLRWC